MNLPESNRDWARRRIEEYYRARISRLTVRRTVPGELEPVRNIADRIDGIINSLERPLRAMEEADRIRAHALGVRL